MADVTISALDPGTPAGTGVIPYSDGNNTTKVTINQVLALQSGVPVGAVFHLATSTIPIGYLKCNGNVVPNGTGTVQGVTANFSALHAVLGAAYGAAGTLPDLRGEFVRGFDDGRGIDTSRAMGSSQLDQLQGHWHSTNSGYTGSTGAPYNVPLAGTGGDATNVTMYARTIVTNGANGAPRIGSETRSRNVALMPVIKY